MSRRYCAVPRTTRSKSSAPSRPTRVSRQRFFDLDLLHLSLRLGSYKVESLYWGVLGERWWRNYLHAHSFFEFCYVYDGKGTYRVRDQALHVQRGDLFLATPGLSHEIQSSRAATLGIYFWACTLLRLPDHVATESDRPVDSLLEGLGAAKTFIARPAATLEQTLELMTDEITQKPPGYTQSIQGLATKLILEAARSFTQGITAEPLTEATERGVKSVVQTAIRYLRDNYARTIEVRDVAAQVHLSERHLSRLFARETGKSILEFLTDLRINAAGQMLLDDTLPIKQIARAVGYPDPHYFTTLFGRRTGMTPGVFRAQRGTKFRDESRRPPTMKLQ